MKRKQQSKYPPYPGSGYDYSVIESARQMLRKPNKVICIYCRHQSVSEDKLTHESDCPARNEKE